MQTWLVVALSVLGGLAGVGAAIFLAFLPEFRKARRNSRMAVPSGEDPSREPIAGIGMISPD